MDTVPEFYAKDRASWRQWLDLNHATQKSVWLVYDKGKNRTLSWDDIVQEALCFGWIDSKPGKVSETQSKLYISKRNPKSAWSKINKKHVEIIENEGLIMPAGQAVIDEAKRNGAWDALNKSDNLEQPPELKELFSNNKVALDNYNQFSNSSKRIILEWIYSAKTEQTKLKRIYETVDLAEKGIKANHYRQ